MRIALDITPIFQDNPSGVSYYSASVVHALANCEHQCKYVLFGVCPRGLREKVTAQLNQIAPEAERRILFVPQKAQAPLLSAMQAIPLNLVDQFIGAVDIMHQFDAYSFASSCISTATVFDLSAQKLPHLHTKENVTVQTLRLKAIRDRSKHFFAISKTVGKELIREWHIATDKVSVAYPPIDNRQALVEPCDAFACLKKKPELFSRVQKNKFFLSVATREPRKNLGTLIDAFEHLEARIKNSHPLVIVGAKGWGSDASQVLSKNIWMTGHVCDVCLMHLYARAHAFVYVSTYEGFGMPIAEAMRVGVPIICSNLPIFNEVVGDAALGVDGNSSTALSLAMREMIAMHKNQRALMIERGLLRIQSFTAKACASAMVSTWVSLVQSGNENRRF